MKKYLLPSLVIVTALFNQAQAYDGIILVLEAPLLREPSLSSTVLQTLRKGSKVYVPNEVGNAETLPEFIPTFDRAGNPAFIPSRYVKVITGNLNEKRQSISYKGNDPTDYRLEEPIPLTYPFPDSQYVRASFSALMGSNANATYSYDSALLHQSYGAEFGARIAVTRRIAYDKYNRFYFGMITFFNVNSNNIEFQNANVAKENRFVMRAGPWITYDAYKTNKYQLSIGSGFTFNYHHSKLTLSQLDSNDERKFTGLSISPMTSTTFQINNIIPNTDFITGADLSLYLPHTLKASDEAQNPELWSGGNQISSSLKAQVSVFLGVQLQY